MVKALGSTQPSPKLRRTETDETLTRKLNILPNTMAGSHERLSGYSLMTSMSTETDAEYIEGQEEHDF